MCDWFNLGASAISQKSKYIRDLLKIYQLDTKWCLPSKLKNHPFAWMISVDGYLIDARHAPYELQIAAYEAGVIPFVPDDHED